MMLTVRFVMDIVLFFTFHPFTSSKLKADIGNDISVPVQSSTKQTRIWYFAMVDETGNEQVDQKDISKFENAAGKRLALVVYSNDWYKGIYFPSQMANIVKQNNAVPIIRMAPWQNNGKNLSDADPYAMSNIVNGLLCCLKKVDRRY